MWIKTILKGCCDRKNSVSLLNPQLRNLNQNVRSHSLCASEISFKQFILESVLHLSPSAYQILSLETFVPSLGCSPLLTSYSNFSKIVSFFPFCYLMLFSTVIFFLDVRRLITMRSVCCLQGTGFCSRWSFLRKRIRKWVVQFIILLNHWGSAFLPTIMRGKKDLW